MKKQLREIPRALGIRKIRDFFSDKPEKGYVKLRIRGYCQTDSYSCGVIAGWSALEMLNPEASFSQFDADCDPDPHWGTSTASLRKALKKQGIASRKVTPSWDALRREIKAGNPVLATIYLRGDVYHWVCIYGYRENPDMVLYVGRIVPGFSRVLATWEEFHYRTEKDDPWLALSPSTRRR
jgi:hypothetical protein